ncbi:MAG: HRDC domain-containing protein [Gammaproteobacteria bacterium]|nr:HRDC domain-containing protein [Gammaproteobacteria bacterium]
MEEQSFMPCKADAVSVSWIQDDVALGEAVASWESIIGIDTEFQRTDTFFPIPGLYQVLSGDRVYLLDPLTISDWTPFLEVLEDPRLTKIMHACSEDLELMRHHFGAVPRGVFDTQLANAFQSADYSTSYANLVAAQLGEQLDKHETRSNWLRRPLSDEQLRYAWEDVHYLPDLHRILFAGLERLGREQWFAEVMADRGRYQPTDPDEYYRNLKTAWRLDGLQLGVLQRLCAWRERKAMAVDVPRNRVVWDEHLLEFAKTRRLAEDAIHDLLPRNVARRYAAELVQVHASAMQSAESLEPLARPLTQSQSQVSKGLRQVAREQAESLQLAHELLARKRDVEACVRHYLVNGELSPAYKGWRHAVVGAQFQARLEGRD